MKPLRALLLLLCVGIVPARADAQGQALGLASGQSQGQGQERGPAALQGSDAVLDLPLPKMLSQPVPNLAGKLAALARQAGPVAGGGSNEAALGLGLCQVLAQQYEAGITMLARARQALPLMGTWAGLFTGLAKFKQRDFAGALAELEPLITSGANPAPSGEPGISSDFRPEAGPDAYPTGSRTSRSMSEPPPGPDHAPATGPTAPQTASDIGPHLGVATPGDPALFPIGEATLLSAYCLEGLNRPAEALQRYRRFLEAGDPSFRSVALWRVGVCAAATGDFPAAEAALRDLIQNHPNTASAEKAESLAQSLFAQGKSPFRPDAPEMLLERARALIDHNQNAKALALLKVLAMSPQQVDQAQVLYLTGKALYAKRDTQASIQTLEDVSRLYPRSEVAPWAMYHQARGYWRLAGPEDYRRMEELLSAAPGLAPERTDLAEACRRLLLLSRLEQGRFAQALEAAAEIKERGQPQSEVTEQAALLLGLIKMALDDPAGAQAALEDFLDRYPNSGETACARYWLGRAVEAQDDPIQATGWYRAVLDRAPNGYYGPLASRRLTDLGQPPSAVGAGGECPAGALALDGTGKSSGRTSGPVGDLTSQTGQIGGMSGQAGNQGEGQPGASEAIRLGLARAALLQRAALPELAERELAPLAGSHPRDAALALRYATLATGLGNHMAAVRVASRAFPTCLAKGTRDELAPLRDIFYPRRFADLISQHLAGSGVDPNLLCGLIRQESFFEQDAVSPAGAVGLMQVMPNTAKTLAAQMGDPAFNPATLRDPSVNIRYGVRFFLERYAEYNGNLAYTLASYNAGRVKLKVWMDNLGGLDKELFVEFIPYTETREYVKRILANQEMYGKLY